VDDGSQRNQIGRTTNINTAMSAIGRFTSVAMSTVDRLAVTSERLGHDVDDAMAGARWPRRGMVKAWIAEGTMARLPG